ncbi:unnamed protein product [Tilletia controversa]|uniref:Uncharacterized protein n=3 Tax=Tilletia TaxID=13289 RepID=A0A8X7SX29_9BASI|nr:hypothetical protein CF336_g4412 [Tilletia laevis]KAE8196616.1 hypothetical protein CF328_g4087 [Tilletia controversa]KAE8260514.1 hypothetical protein A4X03_0g3804 [Tilletia caries]KAE8201744.1 hypothetical protein CF335_g3680 [Tilletia laevis]KAE8247813.1 hypothetical protein A4X06_0g4167 [Tilletia controversa]
MALPRSAMSLRSLAVRSTGAASAAAPAATQLTTARAFTTSRPALGSPGGAQPEETHEEYPREDFSNPFFRNSIIVLAVGAFIYKISDINENLHASRASSSGKSSYQDAEHAEKTMPWITRYIQHWTTPTSEYKETNMQWLQAAAKTAESKLLVQDAERAPVPRLRFVGSFEAHSPHSNRPGSQVDLSDLKIKKDNE